MKSFAQVMGLLFESVRAHTYSRSGQDRTPRRTIDFQHIVKEEHITHLGLLMLSVTYLQNHIKQCYASINSKHEHPPPGNPRGFAPIFSPGPEDLYHLNCPGVGPIIKVPSCQLMPHEGTFQLQTDLPSIATL